MRAQAVQGVQALPATVAINRAVIDSVIIS